MSEDGEEKHADAGGTPVPGASPLNGVPPPEEHRWKPGQSGNPAGRPPSTVKGLAKRLRWMLEQNDNAELDELLRVAVRRGKKSLGWWHATMGYGYGRPLEVSMQGTLDGETEREMRSLLREVDEDETLEGPGSDDDPKNQREAHRDS